MWAGTPSVPVIEAPSRERFEAEIVPAARPVLLKGLVRDWPLVGAAADGDRALADRLAAAADPAATVQAWFADPGLAGRFGYTDDLRGFNHQRRVVPLADLLDHLVARGDDPAALSAYAGAIPVGDKLAPLLPELNMPLLPPEGDRLVSLWLGGRARTAAHWDVPQNIACVVAGRRRFTLFPTDEVRNLYVGPLDNTPAGQAISLVDFHAPDLERFPRFADAMAAAEVAELEPGDALYVPSLWWHHVETLTPFGAMVNFWWRDGPPGRMTPLFTLFHARLTLMDLPPAERAAWRVLFDHYVFGGDPMPHLPAEARGLFAPLTPEAEARLKAALAGPLSR